METGVLGNKWCKKNWSISHTCIHTLAYTHIHTTLPLETQIMYNRPPFFLKAKTILVQTSSFFTPTSSHTHIPLLLWQIKKYNLPLGASCKLYFSDLIRQSFSVRVTANKPSQLKHWFTFCVWAYTYTHAQSFNSYVSLNHFRLF